MKQQQLVNKLYASTLVAAICIKSKTTGTAGNIEMNKSQLNVKIKVLNASLKKFRKLEYLADEQIKGSRVMWRVTQSHSQMVC